MEQDPCLCGSPALNSLLDHAQDSESILLTSREFQAPLEQRLCIGLVPTHVLHVSEADDAVRVVRVVL